MYPNSIHFITSSFKPDCAQDWHNSQLTAKSRKVKREQEQNHTQKNAISYAKKYRLLNVEFRSGAGSMPPEHELVAGNVLVLRRLFILIIIMGVEHYVQMERTYGSLYIWISR
eukprot:1386687-Amorphochlora_amoeboformis.AAC.1